MKTTNTMYEMETKERSRSVLFYKMNAFALILAALLSCSFFVQADTYTANFNGRYDDAEIWLPEYPGNVIGEDDTIVINNHVKLSTDIIVKGTIIVKSQASLMGEKNVVVLDKGLFINYGMSVIQGVTNRGMVYNKHILETSRDLINTGTLINNESMVVGNILDNVGLITGNGGQLIANNKFVNSQTGSIEGNVDVCSSNFMNVDGGRIDSTYMSFCGNRIFNSVFLTANLKKESVIINLLNSENKRYKNYQIERSTDGVQFETIASIKEAEINDFAVAFKYTDKDEISGNSIFYRMRLTRQDGSQKLIPAVEVGNIYAQKVGGTK